MQNVYERICVLSRGVISGEIHLLLIKSQYQRMLFMRNISTLAIKHDFPNQRVEM